VKFRKKRAGQEPDSGNPDTNSNLDSEIGSEHKLLSLTFQTLDGDNTQTFPAEVIEALRLAISRLISKKTLPPRLSLVSALRQEGVTYLSRALATILANDLNTSVCAVELNWWRPDKTLILPQGNKGLAGVLAEEIELDLAILRTDRPNLSILPAGKMAVANRPVFARSDFLKETLLKLSEQYEYMVLDIPAILSTNDSIPLASLGDACCLVVNQGVTSIEKVRLALDEIDQLTVLGVIMNRVKTSTPAPLLNLIPQDPVAETGGNAA
jgi:Mrp family chromosome partitioning ATPase